MPGVSCSVDRSIDGGGVAISSLVRAILDLAGGAGEQSVVTDAMEPLGQNMQQEAPDELVWRECHRAKPRPAIAAVILVAERHTALVEADQPAVRDGDAMCIAGEIGEHRLGPGKGRLG